MLDFAHINRFARFSSIDSLVFFFNISLLKPHHQLRRRPFHHRVSASLASSPTFFLDCTALTSLNLPQVRKKKLSARPKSTPRSSQSRTAVQCRKRITIPVQACVATGLRRILVLSGPAARAKALTSKIWILPPPPPPPPKNKSKRQGQKQKQKQQQKHQSARLCLHHLLHRLLSASLNSR